MRLQELALCFGLVGFQKNPEVITYPQYKEIQENGIIM